MKKKLFLTMLLISLFIITDHAYAATAEICDVNSSINALAAFKLVGIVILIIKIIVPLLLIGFGMVDMAKAVVNDNQDEIKKNAIIFAKRSIAALLVFMAPKIIMSFLGMIDKWTQLNEQFSYCKICVLDVSECDDVSLIKK